MKKVLLSIAALLLIVSIGYCQDQLPLEEELNSLHSKISNIEKQCTPQKGTTKNEVEKIFGKGELAPIGKMPTASPDSPARKYKLCENGILYVLYQDDKVLSAHYVDPYATKGRPLMVSGPDKEPSLEEKLQEARPRLKQMEAIQAAYLKRIAELNQLLQRFDKNSPLMLTIKSDKQVYEVGEEVNIIINLRNIGSHPLIVSKYTIPEFVGFDIIGPDGKKSEHICPNVSIGPRTRSDFISLQAGEFFEATRKKINTCWAMHQIGEYKISMKHYCDNKYHERNVGYKILDAAWTGTLTSNPITIEVREKKGIFSKEEAIKLVQNYIREHNISVIDIDKPLKISEYSRIKENDSWLIHYEYRREYEADPPPWHVFIVDKKTGEVREIGLL